MLYANLYGANPNIRYTDGTYYSFTSQFADNPPTAYTHYSYTTPANKTVESVAWGYGTGMAQTYVKNLQLEMGETQTAFEPYDGREIALPEGLELYGGFGSADACDVVAGVCARRWKRRAFDGTEDWRAAVSEDTGFSLNLSAGEAAKEKAITELYCSHFPPNYGGGIPASGRCYLLSTGLALLLYPPTDSLLHTVEAFKAWLAAQAEAGTPVTVAYQLAEEAEEALGEPTRILPPAPVCHVWADAGKVEVAYNRDVNLAMAACEARLAALEEAAAALLGG